MAIVKHTHTAGSGLTPEQKARIEEAARHPITFTKDCPKLTDEQLAEFRPANFATMEERTAAMRAVGVAVPETLTEKAAGK
jgi:hypothetical protein